MVFNLIWIQMIFTKVGFHVKFGLQKIVPTQKMVSTQKLVSQKKITLKNPIMTHSREEIQGELLVSVQFTGSEALVADYYKKVW